MVAEIILKLNHEPFPHIYTFGEFLNLQKLFELKQSQNIYSQV